MKTKTIMFALALSTISVAVQAEVNCSKPVNQLQATTPSSDFIFHSDGTVTHKRTGLMWQQCMVGETMSEFGECMGSADTLSWQDALQYAQASNFANHSDWRLASVKELSSILEMSCEDPMINEAVFPTKYSSWVWSSTPVSSDNRALTLVFSHGFNQEVRRSYSRGVRLVRDTQ